MTFGSQENPLRASSIPMLMKCPHRHMLINLNVLQNQSGKAADTGSAVHSAIEAYHRGADVEKALEIMRSRREKFPLADLHDAELSFRPYAKDPRNTKGAANEVEVKIDLLIPPWPTDPTGEVIRVIGTADQIREDGLWDVKHSEKPGFDLLHEYSYQLAVYAAALRIPVGGIINPRGYRVRKRAGEPFPADPSGVFFHTCWTQDHIIKLIDEVRLEVARIRSGEVAIRPGSHCSFCPAGGFFHCLEMKYDSPS